jgi:hypothetical protein
MAIPSNLYAEKVFSEHPLAFWSLDEPVKYISLISNSDRNFSNSEKWTPSGCTVEENFSLIQQIDNQSIYEVSSVSGTSFELNAPQLVTEYINKELETVNIGFYFYPESANIASIEFGYSYDSSGDPKYVDDEEESESVTISSYNKWQYVSKSFPIPAEERVTISLENNSLDIVEGNATKISIESHGFSNGDKLKLEADYGLPAGLNKYTIYYVTNAEEDTFEIEDEIGSGGIQFSYPQFRNMYLILVKGISPFIRYSLSSGTSSKSYVHAFTVGQWSEEFSDKYLGSFPEPVAGINLPEEYFGIEASSYGLQETPSYYLARENRLLAKNTNMPLVYGSSSLTSLLPERFGGPSFIIPGQGLLNESGRYKTYTAEFWLRINPDTLRPKRIFGPINSEDGLYVDGPFLTLKIGAAISAHYITEWYRPMLVDLLVFRNGASLMINGETAIDLNFSTEDLELPAKSNLAGKDQDWLGFYSYSDILQFEIDCVAIYSYRVPSAIAKRRWVYGQAIDFPENVASSYSGKSFPIDYTFAGYNNNYIYPDIVRWRQGISENISSKNNVLQPPEYSLPQIIFNNKDIESWNRSLADNYSDSITLKPDESWVDTDGYIYFEKANILEQKTAGFYCVLEAPIGYNSTETLFRLENQLTGNYLSVDLHTINQDIFSIAGTVISSSSHGLDDYDIISFSGSLPAEIVPGKEYFVTRISKDTFSISESRDGSAMTISSIAANSIKFIAHVLRYSIKFTNDAESIVYQTRAITLGHSFVAGINFSDFANSFGGKVSTLISNRSQLRLYVGGNKNFDKTFSGDIYRIGFCTQRNLEKLDYLFGSNGTPFLRYQFDGNAVVYEEGQPEFVADAGYVYEDYVDDVMSHTASYTLILKSFFGQRYLDISTSSYWQDYVPLSYFAKITNALDGKPRYGVDFIQYNADTMVPLFFDEGNYDKSNSIVRTYVSFQFVKSGPTKTDDSFALTEQISKGKIIEPGPEWLTTKYEVVDGTIIYPPQSVDINDIALVTHIEMTSPGIIKNPVRVRHLQLAGKSFNAGTANPIQTKLGVSLFPYKKYGIYYDYQAKNPYTIYKDSTPHLYLNKNSGIELTGDFSEDNRGLSLTVNRERRSEYELSSIQLSMRFTRDDIVTEPKPIMEIENNVLADLIKIWIEPILPESKRFRVYAADNDENILQNVEFYINGEKCSNPVISINEWNMLAIAFVRPVSMDGSSGRINFIGPVMFNNVSYYALNASQKAKLEIIEEEEYVGINPSSVYNIFVGTNKIITGDDIPLSPKVYQYSLISDINVQSSTIKPA